MVGQALDPELDALLERAAQLRKRVHDAQLEVEASRQASQALIAMSRVLIASSRRLAAVSQAEIGGSARSADCRPRMI